MDAVERGDVAAVEVLLARGASPVQADFSGTIPLILAAAKGHFEITQHLLARQDPYLGASVLEQTSVSKVVARDVAERLGHKEIIELLNDSLHSESNLPLLAQQGDLMAVRALLKAGTDPNQRDRTTRTALMAAAAHGHEGVVRELLEAGADPSLGDELYGWTPLIEACRGGHIGVVKRLLTSGSDPNETAKNGLTPLLAATTADATVVQHLLLAGAEPNQANDYNDTPLTNAMLLGNINTVKALLLAGARPDDVDGEGNTALILATRYGLEDIVRLLLVATADPNRRDRDGRTPLMHASARGHNGIMRLLLEAGANLSLTDLGGETALDVVTNRDTIAIKLLLDWSDREHSHSQYEIFSLLFEHMVAVTSVISFDKKEIYKFIYEIKQREALNLSTLDMTTLTAEIASIFERINNRISHLDDYVVDEINLKSSKLDLREDVRVTYNRFPFLYEYIILKDVPLRLDIGDVTGFVHSMNIKYNLGMSNNDISNMAESISALFTRLEDKHKLEELETASLPDKISPDDTYAQRPSGQGLRSFLLESGWPAKYIKAGVLTRAALRHLDKSLYYALYNTIEGKSLAGDVLPPKPRLIDRLLGHVDREMLREARRLESAQRRRKP